MGVSFPFAKVPEPGALCELMPGIDWVCMRLPFALDHVNAWILRNDETSTLIDTGIDSADSRRYWDTLLSRIEISPSNLLITHYHPDHAGLGGWIARNSNREVYFSASEFRHARLVWQASDEVVASNARSWYTRNGLDAQRVDGLTRAGNTYRPLVAPLPESPKILHDGDRFKAGPDGDWRVISGCGHSPEMLCLYSDKLNILIAADQILPSITPNISLTWYLEDKNPLKSFLQSMDKFNDLPEDVLVLPSHGLPFTGLHLRVEELRQHHQLRLESLLDFCSEPRTASDCLVNLFRRELDAQQLMFGMGESLAHLRFLHRAGSLDLQTHEGVDSYTRV